jgi:hypothetical protein
MSSFSAKAEEKNGQRRSEESEGRQERHEGGKAGKLI